MKKIVQKARKYSIEEFKSTGKIDKIDNTTKISLQFLLVNLNLNGRVGDMLAACLNTSIIRIF